MIKKFPIGDNLYAEYDGDDVFLFMPTKYLNTTETKSYTAIYLTKQNLRLLNVFKKEIEIFENEELSIEELLKGIY